MTYIISNYLRGPVLLLSIKPPWTIRKGLNLNLNKYELWKRTINTLIITSLKPKDVYAHTPPPYECATEPYYSA